MKTLTVEGKNDGLSGSQRMNIYAELDELNKEISSVSTKTTFNGNSLLTAQNSLTFAGSNGLLTAVVGASAAPASTISAVTLSPNVVPAAYTFTTVGTQLTLTTTGNSQSISIANAFSVGNNTYNFNNLGISLTITASAADSGANQGAAFAGDVLTISGSVASMKFQSGAAITDEFLFTGLDTRTLNGTKAEYLAVSTKTGNVGAVTASGTQAAWRLAFDEASTAVDNAIIQANTDRAVLGSQMNRLGFISTALMSQSTNTSASRSAIIDTDFAAETASLTKGQIMQQAATAMLAQANQMPNVILSLLK